MKLVFAAACILLFAALQAPTVMANKLQESQLKADLHYQRGNFKKAHKAYLKLAKQGDHYSQDRVSQMYTRGEGKSADLKQAYAWSVLAAESGEEQLLSNSDLLLQRTVDPVKAQSSAAKLKKKYGKHALEKKAAVMAAREKQRKSGSCTGTHLACSRG